MKSILFGIIFSVQIITIVYGQRPLYVIHPKVEKVDEIDKVVKEGANSIKTKINFENDGTIKSIGTSWTGNENFDVYLEGLRKRVYTDNKKHLPNLLLQIFEIDLSSLSFEGKKNAAKKVHEAFAKSGILKKDSGNLNIIILMNSAADTRFMEHCLELASPPEVTETRIGWALLNGDPKENSNVLRKILKKELRIWQFAMTGKLSPSVPHQQLEDAIKARKEGGLAKIGTGFVSREATMRELLSYNIDGIVTDESSKLIDILAEAKFREKYRVAKGGDDPFQAIK